MSIFLSVAISLLFGFFLVVAPWTPLWDSNYFLSPNPAVRALILNAFTRGAVTGLGLVNLLLALHEAHQHLAGGDNA